MLLEVYKAPSTEGVKSLRFFGLYCSALLLHLEDTDTETLILSHIFMRFPIFSENFSLAYKDFIIKFSSFLLFHVFPLFTFLKVLK